MMKLSVATILVGLFAVTSAHHLKLSFHPATVETNSSLIWFNSSTYRLWSQRLDSYLEVYRTPESTEGRAENLVNCNYGKPPPPGKVCNIPVNQFKPCTASNYFGYKKGTPCIFLELSRLADWKPIYFNSTKSLPKTIPNELKSHIDSTTTDPKQWQTVWVSCEGETPADKEFIGPVHYLPAHGFPGYSIMNNNQKGFLNPLLAVFFESPTHGVVVNIECRAWAPVPYHKHKFTVGISRFQILIDE